MIRRHLHLSAFDPLVRTGFRAAYALALAWWFVRRPRTEGVRVAVWLGSSVLLIRNSYKGGFDLPGGGRQLNEEAAAAGARELFEETGVRVAPPRLRPCYEAFCTDEFKRDTVHFYEVHLLSAPSLRIDRREVVWAAFVDYRHALTLTLEPPTRSYLENVRVGDSTNNPESL